MNNIKYGLIGEKLSHSFSKETHSLIGDYEYSICEISAEKLEDMLRKRDFSGLNITIPYKETVIPFLDEVSESAEKAGSVNTVLNRSGRLIGFNTDFEAMKKTLEREKINIKDKKVLILGTGGTSKTAFAVCADFGAKSTVFVSRKKSENTVTYDDAPRFHGDAEVIINTTPVGMSPETDGLPIDISHFERLEAVLDVIYNPIRTRLIIEAQKRKLKTAGGLYMLTYQAILSSEIFLGTKYNEDKFEEIYRRILSQKRNIVLTGMPSCGKTETAGIISSDTGLSHYDTDKIIEEKLKMPIKDIFEKYGEDYFREVESSVIKEISLKNGCVISVGGGSVLKEKNVTALKKNSVLVFLNAPLEKLTATDTRPLSNNQKDLENIYRQRQKTYLSAADDVIYDNSFSVLAKEIERRWLL